MTTDYIWLEPILIFFLILANGFFAASEIAMIAMRKSRIDALVERGVRSAAVVARLKADPDRFLATVQIGVTVISTFASAIGGAAASGYLKPQIAALPFSFAARWAEIIFVTPGLIDVAVEFRNDLRARAVRFGRDPDTLKVLPGIVPVIADTDRQAKALHDQLHELSHPESGLSTLSYHLGVDLSRFPQDQVLPENLDVPGVEGHYREVSELTRRSGLSLAELGQRYGAGRTTSGFAGTPGTVADRMQEWFGAGACDGFMLQVPYLPGGLEELVHGLVPELQRRGLFRTEYDGSTLRDLLKLPRPAS